jgi:hypothetical protein
MTEYPRNLRASDLKHVIKVPISVRNKITIDVPSANWRDYFVFRMVGNRLCNSYRLAANIEEWCDQNLELVPLFLRHKAPKHSDATHYYSLKFKTAADLLMFKMKWL